MSRVISPNRFFNFNNQFSNDASIFSKYPNKWESIRVKLLCLKIKITLPNWKINLHH